MNFLSKKMSITLLAISSGIMLQGAASSAPSKRLLCLGSFADACFVAKDQCKNNVGGYVIQTDEISPGAIWCNTYLQDILEGTIDTTGTQCTGDINFCDTPEESVLYRDELVKVVLKPKYGGAVGDVNNPTDVLIVPLRHYNNTHSLDVSNHEHRELLNRIAVVARTLGHHLISDNPMYTLQTRNGDQQGVWHLHVHFKSNAALDADSVRTLYNPTVQQLRQTEESFQFSTGTIIAAVAGLGLGALAVYGLYSWWKKQ